MGCKGKAAGKKGRLAGPWGENRAGWVARTRFLAEPLSPRGPQPVMPLYGGLEKQPMGRRSQSTGYRGFSTRGPVTAGRVRRQDKSPLFWAIGETVQSLGKSLISLGLSDPSKRLILESLASDSLSAWRFPNANRICGDVIQGKRLATGYEVV